MYKVEVLPQASHENLCLYAFICLPVKKNKICFDDFDKCHGYSKIIWWHRCLKLLVETNCNLVILWIKTKYKSENLVTWKQLNLLIYEY